MIYTKPSAGWHVMFMFPYLSTPPAHVIQRRVTVAHRQRARRRWALPAKVASCFNDKKSTHAETPAVLLLSALMGTSCFERVRNSPRHGIINLDPSESFKFFSARHRPNSLVGNGRSEPPVVKSPLGSVRSFNSCSFQNCRDVRHISSAHYAGLRPLTRWARASAYRSSRTRILHAMTVCPMAMYLGIVPLKRATCTGRSNENAHQRGVGSVQSTLKSKRGSTGLSMQLTVGIRRHNYRSLSHRSVSSPSSSRAATTVKRYHHLVDSFSELEPGHRGSCGTIRVTKKCQKTFF